MQPRTDGDDMNTKTKSFLEALVTAAIVLVLLQTLAEDLLILYGAAWSLRRIFIFTAFGFDLFFTLEFLIRSWNAILRGTFGRYLVRENGWVDFVASIPLLIFTSGPTFLALMGGAAFAGSGGLIGLLKVVKAVRMARVLRLLRLLKIFRRIRFADSFMVQRHTVRIVTTVAASLIFSVTAIGMAFALINDTGTEEAWLNGQLGAVEELKADASVADGPDSASRWGSSRPTLLLVKQRDWTLYAAYEDSYLSRYFGPGDYALREAGEYTLWFDLRPAAVSQSRTNLLVFVSTLIVVIVLMVSYSPHFAITVSDPVNVMLRGLKEKSYNLEVRIPDNLSRDDIFRLAAAYNDEYLPLKERSGVEDPSGALDHQPGRHQRSARVMKSGAVLSILVFLLGASSVPGQTPAEELWKSFVGRPPVPAVIPEDEQMGLLADFRNASAAWAGALAVCEELFAGLEEGEVREELLLDAAALPIIIDLESALDGGVLQASRRYGLPVLSGSRVSVPVRLGGDGSREYGQLYLQWGDGAWALEQWALNLQPFVIGTTGRPD